MKNAIELIRVSTEGQAALDRASIPAQRAINRKTAAANGYQIVRTIEVVDVSGAVAVGYSPEYVQLAEAIKSPDIHAVVTREFSRLMRPENFADYVLLQMFADTRTVLLLPEGPIDFNSKTGRLMGTIRAAIAGMERTEMLERIWSAKEEKRKSGELAQSSVVLPFGVGYEAGRGFHYLPEAERVREAFRLFLTGEQRCYTELAQLVGVTPRGMHLILRNPIWKGWRVIDKRRDMSSSAKLLREGGRQGDRRKIARAAEDVIRVQVITESLVSETDWQRVQDIMDAKGEKHWRRQPGAGHRFVYTGFLTCATCGDIVYGHTRRDDYYLCRNRYWSFKKSPKAHRCEAATMRRDRLEPKLDEVLGTKLTDEGFLSEVLAEIEHTAKQASNPQTLARLQAQIEKLEAKRGRIIDAYLDGTITKAEREARAAQVQRDMEIAKAQLEREVPQVPQVDVEQLSLILQPLFSWQFLDRSDKRQVLSAVIPDIHVADYAVRGVAINAGALVCGDNENHRAVASAIAAFKNPRIFLPFAA